MSIFYINENLDVFFKDWGEDCVLKSTQETFTCIYTSEDSSIDIYANDINGNSVFIDVKRSDVEKYNLEKNTELTIRNTDYLVKEVKKDDAGIYVLTLQEVII